MSTFVINYSVHVEAEDMEQATILADEIQNELMECVSYVDDCCYHDIEEIEE